MQPSKSTRRIRRDIHEWPDGDQAAWSAATAEGNVLDGRGPASHWRPATRKTNTARYGRWLTFLADTGKLDNGIPASRVNQANVRAYAAYLKAAVAPVTALGMLVGLKVMIKAMAPESDWRWLADICNALRRSAQPSVNKNSKTRPAEEIYAAALDEMRRLLMIRRDDKHWLCSFRDALMVAFLACRPLRLGNFSGLQLGRHLLRHSSGWVITISPEEVKNRQALEFDLTPSLVLFLEIYLAEVRPQISKDKAVTHLWVAWQRAGLSYISVYFRVLRTTAKLLGVPINPHLLRDCAATSMSLVSPGVARAAAPLLGHRSFETTEKHYIRAKQLDASRTINAALVAVKTSVK